MQLLGCNLAEARRNAGGRYTEAAARWVALSTLSALEAVHAAGFVHRDVKPANFALLIEHQPQNTGELNSLLIDLSRCIYAS